MGDSKHSLSRTTACTSVGNTNTQYSSQESSSWTMYFEDLSGYDDNGGGLISSFSYDSKCNAHTSSLVSDATSSVRKHKINNGSRVLISGRNLSFKKRRSMGTPGAIDDHDDALEDTASSPLSKGRS
ncbi:hypothetical protein CDL15_Pgr007291 [Punica granatum]|uniref:Uncharacterized protein n=1 Tax=Punica granatum TaxID=22663 RepID=A0A218X8J4_PUNGR|nr:hypothetical protein CDL15_Pgr007291 [Punica granatum]PKI67666.1 hypothetical protein CRG98_011879 [Punica granatum]